MESQKNTVLLKDFFYGRKREKKKYKRTVNVERLTLPMTGDQSSSSSADTSKLHLDQPFQDRSCERPKKIARVEEEEEEEDTVGGEDDEVEGEDQQLQMRVNSNPRIQRYLIAVEYIGTRFSGAQQQSNARTVVDVLAVKFLTCLYQFEFFLVDFTMLDYFGDRGGFCDRCTC